MSFFELSKLYPENRRNRTEGTLYLCDTHHRYLATQMRKFGTFTLDSNGFGASGIVKDLKGVVKGYYHNDTIYRYEKADDSLYEDRNPIQGDSVTAFRGGIYIGRNRDSLIGVYKGNAEGAIAAFHCLMAIRFCYPVNETEWRVMLDAFDRYVAMNR